jgi:hypothetical protein
MSDWACSRQLRNDVAKNSDFAGSSKVARPSNSSELTEVSLFLN